MYPIRQRMQARSETSGQEMPHGACSVRHFCNTHMSKLMLGTKEYMTQIFDEEGRVFPATVIAAGPTVITQIKTVENDGYSALQYGFGSKKAKNTPQPQQGHFKKAGEVMFRFVRELRSDAIDGEAKVGDSYSVADVIAEGDVVTVSGTSKGKGFQGVVKRHNFAGGPRSHGQKHTERSPGSIGGGLRTRVPKGMKMAGRTGAERVTVQNLKVVKVDAENNLLYVAGAVPGRRGTLIEIIKK
jgi:large subunit ribosomal protein L3